MLQFDIITIFPDSLKTFVQESILKRAQQKKKVKIKVHDLRKFTKDKHRKVDDVLNINCEGSTRNPVRNSSLSP